MLNIVIFGAPGSGKGTQSARIVEKYGLNHISTGDVLRAEIKNGTELGKTAKGYIDNGQLIPDALMIDILASVFDSFKDSKGVIFDGFPRTIAQAEALKEMLKVRDQEVSIMLDLEVPEDELMTRLIKRGQESGRADDNEETIKKRLVVYHSQTAPLIDWYKNDGKYCHINGLGSMDGIFADICSKRSELASTLYLQKRWYVYQFMIFTDLLKFMAEMPITQRYTTRLVILLPKIAIVFHFRLFLTVLGEEIASGCTSVS